MTFIKRADLGRPLTWDELDSNFQQVDSYAAAASASASAAQTQAQSSSQSAQQALQYQQAAESAAASAEGAVDAFRQELAGPSGSDLVNFTPYGLSTPVSIEELLRGSTSLIPNKRGYFVDGTESANIHRMRDRAFIGDAAKYTGNRLGVNGYGDSWIAQHAASWIIKNSIFATSNDDDNAGIGILGASRTAPGVNPTLTNCGVAGLSLNEGNSTFGRAFYAEAMHKSPNGTTVGFEIQGGNYTSKVPIANAYSMGNSVINGLMIGMESGNNYTVGDNDTPITLGSNPGGAGIDFCSGSLFANFQKWTVGIVFRDQSLIRDSNGMSIAMSLAQKQSINWEINATNTGAKIWSEVADPATPVGLKLANKSLQAVGVNNRIIVNMIDDTAGAGAVNYPVLKNSRTGINVSLGAVGTDINSGLDIYTQGSGVLRLMSHGGTAENLRIATTSTAPVNFVTISPAIVSAPVIISSAGTDTDIDIRLSPKGAGVLRFGAWSSNSDAAINGYITIKDASGNLRKLATIA